MMGLLVDGRWHDQWYDTSNEGRFVREAARFRNWIGQMPESAEHQQGRVLPAESGRYHLYVSLACPWAHRTLIFRKLKELESHIDVSVVSPWMLEQGWSFDKQTGSTGDPNYKAGFLHQIYTRAKADYSGRVTVPVLWDKQEQTIVSNESSEIIRMMNSAFDGITGNTLDFYPEPLRPDIERWNTLIYDRINNGVYKAGFATEQAAYEEAVTELFEALDTLEVQLATHRYLTGDQLTEADWRLFTTLIRFDAVYVGHFKCNIRRLVDYPNLWGYLRELYQIPGIAETVDLHHIKQHYYYSHTSINPTHIVPEGPELELDRPHGRELVQKG